MFHCRAIRCDTEVKWSWTEVKGHCLGYMSRFHTVIIQHVQYNIYNRQRRSQLRWVNKIKKIPTTTAPKQLHVKDPQTQPHGF